MKVLTAAEMREVDRQTTARYCVSGLALMENAGGRVVEFLSRRFPEFSQRRIVVLCGKGNNGGDGFVIARKLRERSAQPAVILCDAPESVSGDAAVNLNRWRDAGGAIEKARLPQEWDAAGKILASAGIIIDALLGTGLHGPPEGVYRLAIEEINRRNPRTIVVATDIPSGLSSDSGGVPGVAVTADYTVTFTAPKFGLVMYPAAEKVGQLVVADIGSPAQLVEEIGAGNVRWLEPREFRALPLRRPADAHKGDYGHALIVAGSRGKTGAAVLAAWAALRAGAGLVTVATPATELHTVATPVPEVMTEPLKATEAGTASLRSLECGRFADLQKGKMVMAIGPGLSTHQETQQFIRKAVEDCPLPMIVDADGLNSFAGRADELTRRRSPALALTPHPGEMARLLGCATEEVQGRRLDAARRAASEWNAIVILKGHSTVIAAPDGRLWINSTGNPGMATAGTGDVLTGILAGLVAQFGSEHWLTALEYGVYLHGLAGDIAAAELCEASLMASDLIRALPRAFRETLAEMDRE